MPKGYANLDVPAINPEWGYCHPAQSKRTKCACGKTLSLPSVQRRCRCGRLHVKNGGAAFEATGRQPVRPGGKAGCPGVHFDPLYVPAEPQDVCGCGPGKRSHCFSGAALVCDCGKTRRDPTPEHHA